MMRDLFYGVSEQGKAGKHRMDDARALFNAVRWRGAMYLAGYSIECLLKTKLMRMFHCRHLREFGGRVATRGAPARSRDDLYAPTGNIASVEPRFGSASAKRAVMAIV